MPLISIIIPVYNIEEYLPRCVESVLNQTFKDFELILVNDGSDDNSGKLCNEYSLKDSRVQVFNKENGGVSSARNLGIRKSSGKWISFVDGDDFIEENSLQKIVTSHLQNELDLLIARSFINNSGIIENERYSFNLDYEGNVFDGINLIVKEGYNRGSVYGIFYNRSFLNKFNIIFPLLLKNGEDSIFLKICFIYARQIGFANVHFYNVFLREGSASRDWTFDRVKYMVNNIRYIYEYINSHRDLPIEAINILNLSIYGVISNIYNSFYKCFSMKGYYILSNEIRNELKQDINTGKIKTCKNKIKLFNFSLNIFAISVLINALVNDILKKE